jgi:hypothetical protein
MLIVILLKTIVMSAQVVTLAAHQKSAHLQFDPTRGIGLSEAPRVSAQLRDATAS